MKKKNIGTLCYITAVCALLALPTLSLPFALNHADDTAENRVLSSFPSWKDENGDINQAFLTELTTWYGEHFGLRDEMVTAYGMLTREALNTSANDDVICGKENWLFYGETLPDIIAVDTLCDTEIRHIVQTLSMLQHYAESKGAKLIFTSAPNKASIYPQYLPDRYLPRDAANNCELLYAALQAENVSFCDLHTVLQARAAKDPAQLYHKLDSHWNGYGAMVAFAALTEQIGHGNGGFPAMNCSAVRDFDGDLWKMLSPGTENLDWDIVYDIPQSYVYLGRYRSVDDLTIQTTCTEGDGSLLMFRDSFGRALIPLFSQVYQNATYIRDNRVPIDLLETTQIDTVIYELVERNLPNLLQYAPQMPAPIAETPIITTTDSVAAPVLQTRSVGDYLHCYGVYDIALSDNECIVITVQNTDGSMTSYQAFPCYEADLLGETTPQSNGYSLYLPKNAVTDGAVLSIAVKLQSGFVSAGMVSYHAQNPS